jgi:deoxyhypusine synthase
MKSPKDIGKENVMRDSNLPDPEGLKDIHGYDFNEGIDYERLIDSFETTGFQASHLAKSIEIINQMRKEKCTIFLGYTSNMVTSGLRDIFRYLVEHKFVDVIVTTAGGIEEDIIKCFKPFLLGDFNAKGSELRDKGINRTGNIFIPNSRYCKFEDFLLPILKDLSKEQKENNKITSTGDLIHLLGKEINNKESIYYWAYKNDIPVFCPAITDGSMGDMMYFFSYENPEFKIDNVQDIRKLNDITITAKKTGLILLGSGIVKHHILNSNMMRNGANYTVYLNNSQEFDGSDAGARPDEAISWGKLLPNAKSIKVFGDATILFPLIVAKTFAKEN